MDRKTPDHANVSEEEREEERFKAEKILSIKK